MKIEITGRKTIGQIQDEFHTIYPYLKLAFYTQSHDAYHSSPENARVTDRDLTVDQLRRTHQKGSIYIDPDMMVWQIERLFETEFGLHAQVLRKSRNHWLQTSQTDDLTLADQNDRGRLFDTIEVEADTPPDYREQD